MNCKRCGLPGWNDGATTATCTCPEGPKYTEGFPNNPANPYSMKGWECPKCGNVYGPWVSQCWYCSKPMYPPITY